MPSINNIKHGNPTPCLRDFICDICGVRQPRAFKRVDQRYAFEPDAQDWKHMKDAIERGDVDPDELGWIEHGTLYGCYDCLAES